MAEIIANYTSFSHITQEERLLVAVQPQKLFIGIPKETYFQENRVALTPESVAVLVNNGHRVVIETKAGEKSSFTDHNYSEVGAIIAYETAEVYQADIIIKVAPLSIEEVMMTKHNQTIFSALHLPTLEASYLKHLIEKKVTAIAYEYIKDDYGRFPIVRVISEIAGSAAILIGAEYLSNINNGQGILLGGIAGVPPARVVILGGGAVGEYATRTALGLGAEVRVFDNSIYKLMRLQNNVNARVYTSIINPALLSTELSKADLVIGAIHSEAGRTPIIVTKEMVSQMKPGSVIVDVSIDQGGCFETSEITNHKNPVFRQFDVIHYCVPNIASRVSKTASAALSHVLIPILQRAQKHANFDQFMLNNMGMRNGIYLYKGHVTNLYLSQRFEMKYTNLDLLISSSM